MYKEICLFSSFSKTNKKKKVSHLSEQPHSLTAKLHQAFLLSHSSFPRVRLLWRFKARRELQWRSPVESQGQSFKLAVNRRSDWSSYSLFYLSIIPPISLTCSKIEAKLAAKVGASATYLAWAQKKQPHGAHIPLSGTKCRCVPYNRGHACAPPHHAHSLLQVSHRRWDGR